MSGAAWPFVLSAGVLCAVAVLSVLRALRGTTGGGDRAAANAAALASLAQDLARDHLRGLLDADAYAAARDDLQRRVLADLGSSPLPAAPGAAAPHRLLWFAALLLPAAAVVLYLLVGTPNALDRSAAPLSAQTSDADASALGRQLEAHLQGEPADARAWVLLARWQMQRDQFDHAAASFARALQASAKVAQDASIWCEYADALGMAQSGVLAGAPRAAIDRALALAPTHPRALEMAGSAAVEARDYATARRHWQQLLDQLPPGSTAHGQLSAALARLAPLASRRD